MRRLLSIFITTVSLSFFSINRVLAQDDLFGINDLSSGGVALGTKSLQETVAGIINIALGFLGVLATLLILYGGYLWMTSAGNSEKVQRAKLLIISALIGLVIILSAYAIARFILSKLYDVTGPTAVEEEEEPPGELIPCPDDGVMRICYISPTTGNIGSYVDIVGRYFGTDVGEVYFVDGPDRYSATVVPCGGEPSWNNTKVKVKVPEMPAPANYTIELYDAGGSPSLEDFPPEFSLGVGAPGPNIACISPAASPVGDLPLVVDIEGFGFTDVPGDLHMIGWDEAGDVAIDPLNLNVLPGDWTDALIRTEIPANALSSNVIVSIPAGDADEYFTVRCDVDNPEDCASGCCNRSQCRLLDICEGGGTDGPYIEAIYPPNGNEGDLITIFGGNFGDDPGRVVFNYNEGVTIDSDPLPDPPCDGDNWHDDYIIVRVPVGAIDDDLVVIQGGVGGQESNGMLFDQTDTPPRPGICAVSPESGVYEDPITIEGINFNVNAEAYFGDDVASYNTTFVNVNEVTAEVPNVIGSLGIHIQQDDVDSNPYPFSALALGSGDPVIYSIDPTSPDPARVGQAITVMGANFGNLGPDSDVRFAGVSGNFEFPPMCGGGFWENDRIIVKVPEGLPFGLQPVQVWRDEGEDPAIASNQENITLEAGLPGPNLCYLEPNNGLAGTSVTLAGENFGGAAGDIIFQDGQVGEAGGAYSWSDGQVSDILVPGDAETGLVRLVDNDGAASNGMPFNVGSCPSLDEAGNTYCDRFGLGDICCPGVAGNICVVGASCDSVNSCSYTWTVETEADPFGLLFNYNCDNDLQSPSPWPDQWEGHESRDAYPNINLRALFNRDVDDADFNPANISVWRCGEGGLYDITDCAPAAGGVEVAGTLQIVNQNSNREGVVFLPDNPLDENYWYHINLGIFHSEVGNDIWQPVDEGVGFDWHFRTRDSSNQCPVDTIAVSPQSPAANFYKGQNRNFYASPSAENCNMCSGDYNWNWDVVYDPENIWPHDSFATLMSGPSPARMGTANLTGVEVTEPDFVILQSTNLDFSLSGNTSPVILSPRLEVEDYEPNCGDDSCSNGAVWIEFNTEVRAADIIEDNFAVYLCDDGLCSSYDDTFSFTNGIAGDWVDDYFRVTISHPDFDLDGQYIVVVNSSIANDYGFLLNEEGEDFTYNFGVGHSNCEFVSARVSPAYRLAYNNNLVGYSAAPYSDSGICGGEPLQCDGCTFTWGFSSMDGGLAVLASPSDGEVRIRPIADGTVDIDVDIEQGLESVATPPGTGVLEIAFSAADFAVIDHWPDCEGACSNTQIGVKFNSDITEDEAFGKFRILDTADPPGVWVNDGTGGHTLMGDERTLILHHPELEFDHTYQVLIGRDLTSITGEMLGEEDFIWDFTVGAEACEANGLDVWPENVSASAGDRVDDFTAVPLHIDAACGTVPLDYCEGCEYSWTLDPAGVATIVDPNVQNPRLIVDADAMIGDWTDATASILATPYTASGRLNIDESGEIAEPPFIHSIEPVVGEAEVCLNTAIAIQFSERMNLDTIKEHIGLWGDENGDGLNMADLVIGDWSFRSVDFDGNGTMETQAILSPNRLLEAGIQYYVAMAHTVVESSAGMELINGFPSPYTFEVTPLAGAIGWSFTTSDEACDIHSALIVPGPDVFTCAQRNDCVGDDSPFINNNQHQYTALAYDIEGTTLSTTFLSYNWSLNNALLELNVADEEDVLATPLTNYGTSILSVRIASLLADGSSAGDSARIDIFVCQSPWPSVTLYPWQEDRYNFSTFYCQYSGLPGDNVTLPSLEYEPIPNPIYEDLHDPDVLREYIFEVNNMVALAPGNFGSLAFVGAEAIGKTNINESWWQRIASILSTKLAIGQEDDGFMEEIDPRTIPPYITNFVYTEADAEHVVMTWGVSGGRNLDHFNLYRSVNGSAFERIAVLGPTIRTYTDTVANGMVPFVTNTYRLISYSDVGIATQTPGLMQVFTSSDSPVDYIAIRTIRNDEHLSVDDWYHQRFGDTAGQGQLFEVNGYEALRVGTTVYIAATNIYGGHLYTNIYLISHSIGSSANTINVYNQLIQNFKLNTNLVLDTNNVCSGVDSAISCISDFDCPGYCRAQGLKLRRDTKRLGELVRISKQLASYGTTHKACINNSTIACNSNVDCPGLAACVEYYPSLEAGSYLQGFSTSRWPVSWGNTLSSNLVMSLPVDPINLFNGCPDENADPETCWNEEAVSPDPRFSCATNSLVYIYKTEASNQGYYLGANFEYEIHNPSIIGWNTLSPNWLQPATANIAYTLEDCDGEVVNAPGSSTSPYCGNGRIDSGYCSIIEYTSMGSCVFNGGNWVTQEECDLFDWGYGCSEAPPRQADGLPAISSVPPDGANWWKEKTIGCNPPGTIDPVSRALIECTWHRPDPAYTPAQCGGYCGDGTIQPAFEGCEGGTFYGTYICADGDTGPICGTGCQPMCNGVDGPYPAASCGDSVWSEGIEECDPTATPSGTAVWDCAGGGRVRCNNSCEVYCSDASEPYLGLCGDGEVTGPEECDYASYIPPIPAESGPDATYGCTTMCQFTDEYCGDGGLQPEYQELCDPTVDYYVPSTIESAEFRQYACRVAGYYPSALADPRYGACTATAGGWCGNGNIEAGEYCDPGDYWASPRILPDYPDAPDRPADSSEETQYECNYDCLRSDGGWCGDGDAQIANGEICDGPDYPGRPTPAETVGGRPTYTCDMTDPDFKCTTFDDWGPYCGDGVPDYQYLETCDWNNSDPAFWPAPRGIGPLATEITQYQCIDCTNTGGWCGNGEIDTWPGGGEECDSGFDPARIIEKDVDLVYVFDMSASLLDQAADLCTATQDVVNDLRSNHPEINYRISIMVLGDNDDGFTNVVASDTGIVSSVTIGATPTALTPDNHADDLNYYYGATTWPTDTDNQADTSLVLYSSGAGWSQEGWVYKSKLVFRELVSICPLYTNNHDADPTNDFPDVRYLSFYDNATNDIYAPVEREAGSWGDVEYTLYPDCNDSTDFAGRIENWGYAINKIIDSYNWLPDYQRVVVPISDEGAWCGGQTISDYEDYDLLSGWHLVPDILVRAVNHAVAQEPMVHISPVLFTQADLVNPIGPAIARDTMSIFTNRTTNWSDHTVSTINSTFCDGDGDGHMDCSLPDL